MLTLLIFDERIYEKFTIFIITYLRMFSATIDVFSDY